MTLFVRIGSRPAKDLARGYSYAMGCFGDESQAERGLSSCSLDRGPLADVVATLHERMGVIGAYVDHETGAECAAFLCVFEGADVGTGADGEDLCRPSRLVCKVDTRKASTVEQMVEIVRAACARKGVEVE